jgi:hypothetical protein
MTNICRFCQYVFKTENDSHDHSCEGLVRFEKMKNVEGMAVFHLYKMWLSKNKSYHQPKIETFVKSRYYTIFKNLNKFLKKKNIPDKDSYLTFCIEKKLLPNTWYIDDVYYEYLIWFDNEMSAEKHFSISYNTISNIANVIDCDIKDVFKYLNFDEVSKLIHSRNISPWYLLLSKGFNRFYKNLSKEEKIICDSLINRDVWLDKLNSRKDFLKKTLLDYNNII